MILILVLLLGLAFNSSVFAQTSFYQGKTITILVGTKAGDVYDLYPRLLSEFWPKHIPGSPNIIIQNVPGAGSLIAARQQVAEQHARRGDVFGGRSSPWDTAARGRTTARRDIRPPHARRAAPA